MDEELGITLLRINVGRADRCGVGNALIVWEAFKVFGGEIHAVEAFMKIMPADAGSLGYGRSPACSLRTRGERS